MSDRPPSSSPAPADRSPDRPSPAPADPSPAAPAPAGDRSDRPSPGGGRPPALRRGLKVLGTLLITLSAISPASSVFIIAPGVVGQAGSGALWSFLVAAVVGVFMAFVYAELASAYPLSGGEYAIVARTLGKLPGFVTLGLLMVTQLLIIAVIALGVGTYLEVLFPGLSGPVVAAVATAGATVLAVFDVQLNAWITGVFLAIEMVALVVVSALGLVDPARSLGDLLANPVAASGGVVGPASAGLVAGAAAVAIFAYNGYGSAVYFGEETSDAHRGIARAILWALGITVASELIPVTAVLVGAPSLEGLFGAENMMSHFVTARAGSTVNAVISLAVALAILNAVLAIILITSRMVFSTGRDAAWPGAISRGLAAIHPRTGTPWVATLATGAFATALCFADKDFLLVVTATSIVAVYVALCLAALNGRRNRTTAHAAYRMPWFPVAPVLALAALAFVVWQNALDPAVGRPSLAITAGIAVVAALYYLLVVRRRGAWDLKGPEDEG
ncbi:APC family permease [Saccharothrix australiensis]|uniref:Amino acid/polyamine/organocation transporter (APC superfamily) n=1 Tax=Saccharothrix australiensis TaxID=2072 RepID=A0A495W2Z5_9PSEU|nr:APC family permease [Saccharothrix australiensis]RKT55417.1 amino acid/polyamine/organocation transporter (APC superfamily) [Saccharothrix australiensis]